MSEQEYQQKINACLSTLYHVARGILSNEQDCADAVQEAVFQGWIKRGQLRDEERFQAWILRITINECRNLQRRAHKQRKAVEASIENLRQPVPQHTQDLQEALSMLAEKYRLPIVLYYMEGYATREIAAMLGVSQGRVREYLRTGRKLLGRIMDHDAEE